MTNQIYPCLWFDGQAKEAADFYCRIFPNSKISSSNPIVVMMELNGKKIMCLNGGHQFKMNPSISFFLHSTSIDECNRIWNELSAGGTVMMPLTKYPWSELYGWIQDKFGFSWQIMKSDKDRMMPAMLFTGNQLGKAAEAMDFYTKLFKNSSIDAKNFYPPDSPYAGKLTYAEFNLNKYPMVAMDGPSDHKFVFNEGISFVVNCDNQEEIDFFWDNFIKDGGEESKCGWCKDKFGVSWQVVPTILGELMSNPEKSQRVIAAFLKMTKFDIEKLINA